jgi:hypothetical protein
MKRNSDQRRFVRVVEFGAVVFAFSLSALHPASAHDSAMSSCDTIGSIPTPGDWHRVLGRSMVYPDAQYRLHNAMTELTSETNPRCDLPTFDLMRTACDAADEHWRVDQAKDVFTGAHQPPFDFGSTHFDPVSSHSWNAVATSPKRVSDWLEQQPEPAFIPFHVTYSWGASLDFADVHVDPKYPAQLALSLPSHLLFSSYRLVWAPVPVAILASNSRFTFIAQP